MESKESEEIMIKLLNEKEFIAVPGEIKITGDSFVVEGGETRGTPKQCALHPFGIEAHMFLSQAIKILGLQDYINMERDGETTYIKVIVEED